MRANVNRIAPPIGAKPCSDCGADFECGTHRLAEETGLPHLRVDDLDPVPAPGLLSEPAARVAQRMLVEEFGQSLELSRMVFGEGSLSFSVFAACPDGMRMRASVSLDCCDIERGVDGVNAPRPVRTGVKTWSETVGLGLPA